MKILVTGAKGFVGKNLICALKNSGYPDICAYDVDSDVSLLAAHAADCGFVFHLAGVNRPADVSEFTSGNVGPLEALIGALKKSGNRCPVALSSSIQAELDNPYGRSKKSAEDALFAYAKETGVRVCVYRFPNVFGKWCRPDYNSAVATFCHNIAGNLPITVNNPDADMKLVYIDDVSAELVNALEGRENRAGDFCAVPVVHEVKLGEIARLIYSFRDSRENLSVPKLDGAFEKALYSTYLSYLPSDGFSYPLKVNADNRGSFTEIIKTPDRGQFSVNITKPGITKGNHWHNTKCEKFLVVSGKGLIRFRKIGTKEIIDYRVSGEKLELVDIPTGYTHNIANIGDTDLVTFMWANEAFDPEKPDTYYEVV